MENDNVTTARVIISCDASPLGAMAIDAAVALARELDAELTGIFVEDINLFRTAALPFTHEVAWSSALPTRLQADELQRALERQAQAVRDVLARAASALRRQWSFQVVRGVPLGSVIDAMQGLDVAVFGHAGKFSASLSASLSAMGPAPGAARRAVMVVFDGTPAAQRALDAAMALAHDMHGKLVIAVTDAAGGPPGLRAQLQQRLKTHHAHALFLTLKRRDAAAVSHAAETYAPSVLLWGGMAGDADRATVATLVDALRCPVILVA